MKKAKHISNHDSVVPTVTLSAHPSRRGGHSWTRGQLVRSLAGRDKGQYYIVLDQADDFLLVADGRKRTTDHLKRKNPRHLQIVHRVAADLRATGQEHPPTNEEIRAAIAELLSCETGKEGD